MSTSGIDYSNFLEKINVLYDFIIKKDTCLVMKNVNPRALVVRKDIKKHTPDLSCLRLKLDYRSSDKYKAYFNTEINGKQLVIAFGVYKSDNVNLDQPKRKEIVDMIVTHLLSVTISVPMPIINFDISLSQLNEINKVPSKFLTRIYSGLVETDSLYVNVYERFNEFDTLKKLITNKELDEIQLKTICVLVLIWLCNVQSRFPTFRHNSLSVENVLVYRSKEKKSVYRVIDKSVSLVTTVSVRVKDFFNATISGVIETQSSPRENPYYDVFYFFQSLRNISSRVTMPESVMDLINKVVPEIHGSQRRFDEAIFQLETVGITTPYDVLIRNNFFSSSLDMNIAETIESDDSFDVERTDIVASDISSSEKEDPQKTTSISGTRKINTSESVGLVTEDDSSSSSDIESVDSMDETDDDIDFVTTESIARAYGETVSGKKKRSESSESTTSEESLGINENNNTNNMTKMGRLFGVTQNELMQNNNNPGLMNGSLPLNTGDSNPITSPTQMPTQSRGFRPKEPHSMVANIILSKLPDRYYGPVPDHFVTSLPSLTMESQATPIGSFNTDYNPMQQVGGGPQQPLVAPGILKKKD